MMAVFHHSLAIWLVCVIICCMYARTACDKTVSSNGIYTKVLGQSGKIAVGKNGNPASDPNSIVITFDSITEVDANGNTVGKSGQNKHSFQTFASLSFSFSEIRDVQFENITAKAFTFSSIITSVNAELTVEIFAFTEPGNLTIGDEVTSIMAGDVKFNILIRNWTFCGGLDGVSCKQGQTVEEGKYLDFVIEIKGKQTAKKNSNETAKTNGDFFNFGGNSSVIISNQVQYNANGSWISMPENYPSYNIVGSKQLFGFRFERFTSSVLYDPTITLGGQISDNNEPDTGSVKTVSLVLLLCSIIMQQLSLMVTKN